MKTFLKALCFLIDVVLFFGCFFVLNKIGIDKNGLVIFEWWTIPLGATIMFIFLFLGISVWIMVNRD